MTNFEKNKELLKNLGLSQTDIKVYLDLLEGNLGFPNEIAHRTKVHRTNVYNSLNTLTTRGLIAKSKKDEKVIFTPTNPQILIEEIKKKEFMVKQFIDQIEKNTSKKLIQKPKIRIIEGESSFSEAIIEAGQQKKEMYIFGYSENMQQSISKEARDSLMDQRIEQKIAVKCLTLNFSKDNLEKFNALPKTFARNIKNHSAKSDSFFTKIICGNKVFTTLWYNPLTTIVIESKEAAESEIDYFEMLWEISK